jgi:DNA-binding NarL/FixJ family response regulator
MPSQIRLMLIDDHPMFREGVVAILAAEHDIVIVGQGETLAETLASTGDAQPNVVLLDLDIPGGGLQAISLIRAALPDVRVIILTASTDQLALKLTLEAGAAGYVVKGLSARDLAGIIRTVAEGGRYIAPDLAAHLLFEILQPTGKLTQQTRLIDGLNEREREILTMVANGWRNREIAEELHISEKTVKYHLTSIMQKLQVRSRLEAALIAKAEASA